MKITVYRPNQIGGCITELESEGGSRIIIDVGSNLPGNAEGECVDVAEITRGCDGVFITHYHGDHLGEFEKVDLQTPVFMGEVAHKIFLNLCEHLQDRDTDAVKRFNIFRAGDRILAGDIAVTPYRVDHSAYDSYMFLVECDGKRVLHTGDFRTHGWTGKGVEAMLQTHVKNADALICEGTMLSRPVENVLTEFGLYRRAQEYLRDNRNLFVLCSSTNIDTIASFYKAAKDTGRLVVADGYQRKNLDIVTKHAENHKYTSNLYKFPHVMVYYAGRQDCIDKMRSTGFCMFVRPRGDKFKEIMRKFPDHLLIYSMWDGYLPGGEAPDRDICDFVAQSSYVRLHTSGHATEEAIIKVCETIRPDTIFPIHSKKPDRFEELSAAGIIGGKVRRLASRVPEQI